MNETFVYFLANASSDAIRIGYSADAARRLADHAKYGFRLLAIIPASMREEMRLGNHVDRFASVFRDHEVFRSLGDKPWQWRGFID